MRSSLIHDILLMVAPLPTAGTICN